VKGSEAPNRGLPCEGEEGGSAAGDEQASQGPLKTLGTSVLALSTMGSPEVWHHLPGL
jgi:hypothetical protein